MTRRLPHCLAQVLLLAVMVPVGACAGGQEEDLAAVSKRVDVVLERARSRSAEERWQAMGGICDELTKLNSRPKPANRKPTANAMRMIGAIKENSCAWRYPAPVR